jgi:Family of unknown function (DUF6174)
MKWKTAALVLVVASAACTRSSAGGQQFPGRRQDASRPQWEVANVSDYSWSFLMGCMACGDYPGPFQVKVVDDRALELRGTDFKGNITTLSIGKDEKHGIIPLTVEGLFDILDTAYAKDAQTVEVSYNPALGYPTHIYIDPNYGRMDEDGGSSTVSDDETECSVKSLQPA